MRRDAAGGLTVHPTPRPKTPWRRLLPYLVQDRKRKLWLKLLRLLPAAAQDRILEKRYRATMGELPAPARARGA